MSKLGRRIARLEAQRDNLEMWLRNSVPQLRQAGLTEEEIAANEKIAMWRSALKECRGRLARIRPCYCDAFPFPHRVGSGECEREPGDQCRAANAGEPTGEGYWNRVDKAAEYGDYLYERERDRRMGI